MAHPVDVHVGKRLKLRRNSLGLSQEAIGHASGVTFQQVQKYERGVNRMGASRLFQYAKILSVPIEYFFAELDMGLPTGVAEDAPAFEYEKMANRETLELMRAYHRIEDPRVRKKVFDLIKSLAEEKPAK